MEKIDTEPDNHQYNYGGHPNEPLLDPFRGSTAQKSSRRQGEAAQYNMSGFVPDAYVIYGLAMRTNDETVSDRYGLMAIATFHIWSGVTPTIALS